MADIVHVYTEGQLHDGYGYAPLVVPQQQQQFQAVPGTRPPTYNAVHPQQGGASAPLLPGAQPQANHLPYYYNSPPPAEDNHDVHVYYALAMILSVIFLSAGIGVLTAICLVPAMIYARQGITAGNHRQYSLRNDYGRSSLSCIIAGCVIGSLGVAAFTGAQIYRIVVS